MAGEPGLESVLRRDRAVVMSGMIAMVGLAWLYLARLASGMESMPEAAMSMRSVPWGAGDIAMTFAMWTIMMIAMMLPGAAPMVLLFATINRKKRATGRPFVPTAVFVLGYLAVWMAYSAAATLAQWWLHDAALLSSTMAASSTALSGALLLVAGAFQWTPLKHACLEKCRSPLDFVMTRWREGHAGAFRMGVAHGTYCLGCCWAVMCLLFVGGVMNLVWVAGIALFVVAEKVAPHGAWLARASGAGMAALGVYLLFRSAVSP